MEHLLTEISGLVVSALLGGGLVSIFIRRLFVKYDFIYDKLEDLVRLSEQVKDIKSDSGVLFAKTRDIEKRLEIVLSLQEQIKSLRSDIQELKTLLNSALMSNITK